VIELVDKKANPLRAAAGKLKAKIEPLSSYYLLPSAFCLFIYLLCLPIYCLLRVFGLIELMQVMTFVIPIALCAFSVAHAAETHGAKVAALLFGSGALISLGTEMLGTATGLLFGNYTYTEHMGYKLFGLVPWLIPVAWCSMLYPVWCCIRFLFPFSHSPLLLVSLSALAVTAWDLSLDPRMVQDGNWIWRDGGFYFGVPLSNYVGWVVTAGLVYAVWWLVEIGDWRLEIDFDESPVSNLQSHLPVWAYIIVWLGESVANVLFWAGPWVGLCVFVGMGVFAVPTLRRLVRPMQAQ
jgi:putative membrane protein